jgi:hypothetical protein
VNISELVAALNKVNQVAGDIPIVLHELEGEAETEVKALILAFDPTSGETSSKVAISHGPVTTAPPAAPEPAVSPPAA